MGGFLINLLNKSQWLALSYLMLAVLLLYMAFLRPLLNVYDEYQESIAESEFKLQRLRQIAAGKNAWLKRLDEIKQNGARQGQFILRDSPALASADLQTRIKSAITQASGELISTQVIPERKEDPFTRISVKVRMTGSIEAVREVLYAFESENPILFIENFNIRPFRFAPSPNGKQIVERLSVDFDVIGYMRAG